MTPAAPSRPSDAWAALLKSVPDRHRGPTWWRARAAALHWCALGLADHAAALGWDEVELFGVREVRPFAGAPLRGAALSGVPHFLTDRSARFADGRVVRRGDFGPGFVPVWCLDRRRARPARRLVRLPSGLWTAESGGQAA